MGEEAEDQQPMLHLKAVGRVPKGSTWGSKRYRTDGMLVMLKLLVCLFPVYTEEDRKQNAPEKNLWCYK